MLPETDARAILKSERIDYWIGVGAQPSHNVGVLIKKYGSNGTHLEAQQKAIEKLAVRRGTAIEKARAAAVPITVPVAEPEPAPEAASTDEAAAESTDEATTETPATEATAEATTEEKSAE